MKKIFGYKSITHLLYGIIVLLPFLTILGRCVYVIANKNAYQSYYAETLPENRDIFTYDLQRGHTYYIQTPSSLSQFNTTGGNSALLTIDELEVLTQSSYDFTGVNRISFYTIENTRNFIMYFYKNNDTGSSFSINNNLAIKFKFNFVAMTTEFNTYIQNNPIFYTKEYSYGAYLDNAFEYSISTFTQESNFGNVDLFSWFTDIFLDTSNAKNMLYINFVNWYLNYTLFVSCGYLLFLVLLWFINYSRSLLEKGMNKDYGGY